MSAVINTNIASLNSQNQLSKSQSSYQTALQRLSSGLRINSAKDDAAGMAISDRLTTQIKGNTVAARNANDAISLSQTAEGAMDQVTTNLQRIRELAVQSLNATNSTTDRASLNAEVQQLVDEIDRVASTTNFNGVKLLDGTFSAQTFQVGANQNETISITSIASMKTADLGANNNATTSSSGTLSAVVGNGDVTININGNTYAVGASVAGTNGKDADSAYSIARAINTASSGVTATANSNTTSGTVGATAGVGGTVQINGVAITIGALTTSQDGNGAAMVTAINSSSATTGVKASYAAGSLTLTAADGRNIDIGAYGGSLAAGDTGLVAATKHQGNYTLKADATFTIGGTAPANAGFTGGATVTADAGGTALSQINVTSVANANTALATIDAALTSLNSAKGAMGAYQNRFASVVTNLNTTTENLTSARSRIQDADFASETANLTRASILQQAGTAMLAQANQAPNTVLSLLK